MCTTGGCQRGTSGVSGVGSAEGLESKTRLLLSADADALAQLDAERLREDLRKLYVALTRARFATWVGAAPVKGLEASALGHLLGGPAVLAAEGLEGALQRLRGDEACIAVHLTDDSTLATPEAADVPRWQPPAVHTTWRDEPALPARPAEAWGFTSYSAMLH
ncbi:MAG: hypothetical protein ACKOD9_20105, partial [Rubrivivax sp.]